MISFVGKNKDLRIFLTKVADIIAHTNYNTGEVCHCRSYDAKAIRRCITNDYLF